jgi:uncharacterized protein YdeI (YjbR/CyaY-like superfamily)
MASSAAKSVRAPLEHLPGGLGWIIARLPFDPQSTWKKMVRLRVSVEIEGQVFRTSLFTDAVHGGQFVLFNKKMQKAAGAGAGGMVDFTIAPDLKERVPSYPPELEKLLKREKALAKWMANLSVSTRYEIGKSIEAVKSPEARQRRVEQMAERLLLTMEGEKELPPILEMAFRNSPGARKGWEAMSPIQRRSHLMGVFYYQSPEARMRRAGKVVDDCLKAGHK